MELISNNVNKGYLTKFDMKSIINGLKALYKNPLMLQIIIFYYKYVKFSRKVTEKFFKSIKIKYK
jgi:hypothetical protein